MTALRSFRVRVTLWYVAWVAVLLVALALAIYFVVRGTLNESLRENLEQRLAGARATLRFEDDAATLSDLRSALADDDSFARLLSSQGDVLDSDGRFADQLPVDTARLTAALDGRSGRYRIEGPGEPYLATIVPVRSRGGAVIAALEVGVSRGDTDEALDTLLIVLLIAVPTTIVVAGGGGLLIARRALRPIRDMTDLANEISADELDRRIDYAGPPDELGQLAQTLDSMLDRLEASFEQQRRFTADAAHELRTPLTAIRGQIDVALRRERSPGEYRDVLQRVGGQSERLTQLVESLLLLARAAGQLALETGAVELSAIVADSVAAHQGEAAERGVALTKNTGRETVAADPALLRLLIDNLLRNALAVTPSGGSVMVRTGSEPDTVLITVTDTGPGIPEADLERIFDRFYRVQAARSRQDGGAGLGLAICRTIAEAHGGSIGARNRDEGGAEFAVRLPASG